MKKPRGCVSSGFLACSHSAQVVGLEKYLNFMGCLLYFFIYIDFVRRTCYDIAGRRRRETVRLFRD